MDRRGSLSSLYASFQTLARLHTDTDTSINNSFADPAIKCLSLTVTGATIAPTNSTPVQTTAFSNATASHQFTAGGGVVTSEPQSQEKPAVSQSPSRTASSTNLPAQSTSMSFSSVDDTRNLRMRDSNNNGYGGRRNRQSPPWRRRSADNSVMDAVSRSLNTHNDPELEGLPPMGDEPTAGGSTLFYDKGFLISTSPGADRDPGVSNISGRDFVAAQLQDEGQQQQQSQHPHKLENSGSDASRSRGPATSASGISHRLLTAEEIQQRRCAASRSASHATSRVQMCTGETNKGFSNNSSVGTSANSKPAHRQLSKEETEKLIAQRQQQFKGQEKLKQQLPRVTSAATNASPPPSHMYSAHGNAGVSVGSAPLTSSATPWPATDDGTQATQRQGLAGQAPPPASTGGAVAFEWLRGATAGVGGFADPSACSWPKVHQWRDNASTATAGAVRSALFSGVATGGGGAEFGDAGDGRIGANGLAIPSVGAAEGGATGAYTWLANASHWSSLQQQQQQQLIPSVTALAAAPRDTLSFMPSSHALLNAAAPLGSAGSTASSAPPSGLQFTGPLAGLTLGFLQSLSTEQIEGGMRQCEEQILRAQHDREMLALELQRRQYALAGTSAHNGDIGITGGGGGGGGGPAAATAEAMNWAGALHTPTKTNYITKTVNSATGGGGSANTGSPSRFFSSPCVEGLPQSLDTRASALHIATGLNFSTVAGRGMSSIGTTTGGASEQRYGSSDGPAAEAAASSGASPSKTSMSAADSASGGCWEPAEHLSANNSRSSKHHKSSVASRRYGNGNRSCGHSSVENKSLHGGRGSNNASVSLGTAPTSAGAGRATSTGNRCSHDNTPQEQKYLQTDPFSMYEHNKKITAATSTTATAAAAAPSSKDATA
ncbi:hypothetical protein ABL78_2513 [Leptomonas seymouri]|uniref:Uncharacterized protein n=1 Tax=Leptomonas seymouri TaxID=5684 RepID=A0A0N1HZ58_LEPSE|nr:hypothetical protein ABL78_2513 [Leptomonas seymouri]|eukprot:KPI88394.1 hypothetical protein ABL78_2513 [Leptomonas seymouri]